MLNQNTNLDIISTATKLSRDVEWTVREAIASRLGYYVDNDEKNIENAVSLLTQLARDVKPEVRMSASHSLARIPHKNRLITWIGLCRDIWGLMKNSQRYGL